MACRSCCLSLSFTALRDRCYSLSFAAAGLRPFSADLGSGTVIRGWSPRSPDPARPKLLLIHGFGASATWQWGPHLRPLLRAGFDLYVPDLLFFGGSAASVVPDYSESFQARCVMAALSQLGVDRLKGLVGVSYGGFVGYRMAEMFPAEIEKVVLCCAGVCLEEDDLEKGLFVVDDVNDAAEILLPQSPEKLRQLVQLSFVKPPPTVPDFFLRDYIQVMCTEYFEEKTQLIHALIKDRKLSDLPKITQPTMIVWGEQDQIFPLELGHRLKRHLGENSQLVVIKNAGHAVNLEKSKELCRHIKEFLVDSSAKGYNIKSKASSWWQFATRSSGLSLKKFAPNSSPVWREDVALL